MTTFLLDLDSCCDESPFGSVCLARNAGPPLHWARVGSTRGSHPAKISESWAVSFLPGPVEAVLVAEAVLDAVAMEADEDAEDDEEDEDVLLAAPVAPGVGNREREGSGAFVLDADVEAAVFDGVNG